MRSFIRFVKKKCHDLGNDETYFETQGVFGKKVSALKLWEDARLGGGFPLARPASLTGVLFY